MLLLLNTTGIHLLKKNNSFFVKSPKNERMISPKLVSSILISGHVIIHGSAFRLANSYDIPFYFLERNGDVSGVYRTIGFNNASIIRRNQVLFLEQTIEKNNWVLDLFNTKITNQLANLDYIAVRKTRLKNTILADKASIENVLSNLSGLKEKPSTTMYGSILGYEGAASRVYWSLISASLDEEFRFVGRSKHPAADPFNAALNYLYGMTYTMVESALHSVGLDPTLGIFHADQYQKPTLSFDFIEPFRPWVDRFLVSQFWHGGVAKSWFEYKGSTVLLAKEGKKKLIPDYLSFMEEKVKFNRTVGTRKGHIYKMAGEFAKHMLNFDKSCYT